VPTLPSRPRQRDLRAELREELLGLERPLLGGQEVAPAGEELRRRDVDRDGRLVARPEARALDSGLEQVERLPVRGQRRTEAALVGDESSRKAPRRRELRRRPPHAPGPLERLGEGRRAHRNDEEVLEVDRAAVGPTGEDVHHREREQGGGPLSEPAVARHTFPVRRRESRGDRDGEDGVRPQAGESRRAVGFAQDGVQVPLIGRVETPHRRPEHAASVIHGAPDAEASIPPSTVSKLQSLVTAPGRARRYDGRASRAAPKPNLAGDGRASPRIERLPGPDLGDARVH
jgi:hypothetical protein